MQLSFFAIIISLDQIYPQYMPSDSNQKLIQSNFF